MRRFKHWTIRRRDNHTVVPSVHNWRLSDYSSLQLYNWSHTDYNSVVFPSISSSTLSPSVDLCPCKANLFSCITARIQEYMGQLHIDRPYRRHSAQATELVSLPSPSPCRTVVSEIKIHSKICLFVAHTLLTWTEKIFQWISPGTLILFQTLRP